MLREWDQDGAAGVASRDRSWIEAIIRSACPEADDEQIERSREATKRLPGGRDEAKRRLARIDPVEYGRTRNHLDGAVTRLSPYLRHGVLGLREVLDVALSSHRRGSIEKFVQELAWRDFYQRVWRQIGSDVWEDLEPYKTGWHASDYADDLPIDVREARTGIDYIDAFVRELHETGYLHNHARMWMAAYVVHGRRVKWQAGARWFLEHLLDGDEASNNLSWQWCASTFSHKPYIFNRANVLKYSGERFAGVDESDPFDDGYEAIAQKLFPRAGGMDETAGVREGTAGASGRSFWSKPEDDEAMDAPSPGGHVVWVHDGMLSVDHPAMRGVMAGEARAIFVVDRKRSRRDGWSAKRWRFIGESLAEMPVRVVATDDVGLTILGEVERSGVDRVVTASSPDPAIGRVKRWLESRVTVEEVKDRDFVELEVGVDLKRFSRYWSKAERRIGR